MEKFLLELGRKKLEVETRKLAGKAGGSCLVKYGDTVVLGVATMSKEEKGNQGFFPLTVEYQERYYAAGKILGSRFIRRENRPTDEAILTSRLIDRTIRPKFPHELKKEVQVITTCLSWDKENDPDIIALCAASIALGISDIPWNGPIAGLRIGKIENEFILNPTYEEREKSELDLLVSGGNKNGEFLINMIDGEGRETEEQTVLKAIDFASPYFRQLIELQEQIKKERGRKKLESVEEFQDLELETEIKELLGTRLEKFIYEENGTEKTNELRNELSSQIEAAHQDETRVSYAMNFFEEELSRIISKNIINVPDGKEKRPDGRKINDIRDLSCEIGLLPRTHGSGLFQRGETASLSILTLGAPNDVKISESMEFVGKKRFMHHYNFPPYCSGETKPLRGPGRREIGHGMLAEKALFPLIPDFEQFPYTIRVVTEILSSNGSSSMASICSSSLALMDAGVPIKAPAAGIAMGLITDQEGKYKILTDIQGPEDHYGNMDLKIAGTKNGITAIQMDVKITGINKKILQEALEEGKAARLTILKKIEKTIPKPRPELSPWAPRIYTLQINPEKIGAVIGPGGKMINEIIDNCEVSIDIENSGKIFISAPKEESAQKAISWIKGITKEANVGEVFQGKVKRIMNFGAFVEILPGQEGLIHISHLSRSRVEKVEDVVKLGDIVSVKVISIDEQGRINLSMKETEGRLRPSS